MMGLRMLCSLLVAVTALLSLTVFASDNANVQQHDIVTSLPAFIGPRPTIPIRHKPISDAVSDVNSNTFSQTKDHTSNSDTSTFTQRFFNNTLYANGSQIHFLYVESTQVADSSKIGDETYPMVALAKSVGATLWLLEHRFYGQSRPFTNMDSSNLAYLTSGQAVEDIATFINSQNTASGESNPRWVLFGSAYSGALALWFRAKYPNLCIGAVASSPLVSVELDNYQYELNLREALQNYSFNCESGAKLAARAIRQEMQYANGQVRLNSELHLTPSIDGSTIDYKLGQYINMLLLPLFQYPVMYNHVNTGVFGHGGDIDDLCKIMANETIRNIDKIYQWANVMFPDIYGSQDDNSNWKIGTSYSAFVSAVQGTTYANDGVELNGNTRLWLWQSCREFGTWTTTDYGRNIFGTEMPNSYWIALCADVFGSYDVESLKSVLTKTGVAWDTTRTYNGTNVVITNGGHDPWRTLVPNKTLDASAVIFVADGIGHNADLQPPMDTDPMPLQQARSIINSNVLSWLNPSSSAASNVQENVERVEETERAAPPSLPQPKSWIAKVSKEHPDPARLARIRNGRRAAVEHRERSMGEGKKSLSHGKYLGYDAYFANMTIDANLETWYIENAIDHFDPTLNLTYQQRYMVNDRYVAKKHPPNFLFIGGERNLDSTCLEDWKCRTKHLFIGGVGEIEWDYMAEDFWQWVQWSKDLRARMYVLEHRYYGDSLPFDDTSVQSLKYLQTEQVLADMAVFINTMNANTSDPNPRWILFGGSYAGNLVAAMRVRYPDLTIGAVASSAPIQATVDFWAYERFVESALSYAADGIQTFFYYFQRKMMSREGRYTVKIEMCQYNDWHEDNYVDEKDLQLMYWHYADLLNFVIQYDDIDGYLTGYFTELFEGCGVQLADDLTPGCCCCFPGCPCDCLDDCQWLSEYMIWFVSNPASRGYEYFAEYTATSRAILSAIREVYSAGNATEKCEKKRLIKEKVAPIFTGYKNMVEKGNLAMPHLQKYKKSVNEAEKGLEKPGLYDDDTDSSVSTVDTDYNDPSQEPVSTCEGSNWDGSSGCGLDYADVVWQFSCPLCCYCDFVSYDRHVYYYEQPTLDDPFDFLGMDMRVWTYQMCTEWGYMISNNYGKNMFQDTIPVNFLVDLCGDVFGDDFNRTRMENMVRNTNYLYGGQDGYNGTNIMFINGSEDPYHVLSVYGPHVPLNPDSVTAILMDGTSHCEDMAMWRANDKSTVANTHKTIKKQLLKWLKNSKQ